jgi:hypothetical protein
MAAVSLAVAAGGHSVQVGVAHHTHGGHRVERGDGAAAVAVVVDHHVAGQHQADALVGRERLKGQRRIAGADDHVALEVDVQLGPHGGPDVDLGQHAEALLLERSLGLFDGLIVVQRQHGGDARDDVDMVNSPYGDGLAALDCLVSGMQDAAIRFHGWADADGSPRQSELGRGRTAQVTFMSGAPS